MNQMKAYALGYFLAPLRGWANLFPPLRDVFAAAATIVA